MTEIRIDTDKMEQYAERLDRIHSRILDLDSRLNGLYGKVGLCGLYDLIQADALTGFSWRLIRCKAYLIDTAADFRQAENEIMKQDPLNFREPLLMNEFMEGVFQNTFNRKLEYQNMLENLFSAGEFLTWAEQLYQTYIPRIGQILITELIPSEIRDIYHYGSGILQRDLTSNDWLELASEQIAEIWANPVSWFSEQGVSDAVFGVGTKAVVLVETIGYALSDRSEQRQKKNERNIQDQMRELDGGGVLIDTVESCIDTLAGGTVEVVFSSAGVLVDTLNSQTTDNLSPGKKKVMKTIDGGWRYATGHSMGESIAGAGQKISDTIDWTTDQITAGADIITSAFTQGCKNVGSALADWIG